MRALFTRKSVSRGTILAEYTGRIISPHAARTQSSQYLMNATSKGRGRRRVVIDGSPPVGGAASYANYTCWERANAMFVDASRRAPRRHPNVTCILLIAKCDIPAGVEVRVDYDTGSRRHRFRKQMIDSGIRPDALDSSVYCDTVWKTPRESDMVEPLPAVCIPVVELDRMVSHVTDLKQNS